MREQATLMLCGLLLLVSGCNLTLTRTVPVKQYYLLDAGAEVSTAPPVFPFAIKIVAFEVAPSFEDRGFVYRVEDQRYESDFYNAFFITPRSMVTSRIAEWLGARHIFSAALPPSSALDAPYAMEGLVSAMYGDLRNAAEPGAVFSMQVFVTQTHTPERRIMLERTYAHAVRVPDRSAESVSKGMSLAFQQCLADLERDLRTLDLPAQP